MKNKYFNKFLKVKRIPEIIPEDQIVKYAGLYMKFLSQNYEHYMFNDGRVIYGHCQMTLKFCDLLAKPYKTDKDLLRVSAFLHESGKAYEASWQILKKSHEKFNWLVSKELISRFGISKARKDKLKKILLHKKGDKLIEAKILHEADMIAFFADRKAQKAFASWAKRKNLNNELERKFRNINRLKLKNSRRIALPLWEKGIVYWKRAGEQLTLTKLK